MFRIHYVICCHETFLIDCPFWIPSSRVIPAYPWLFCNSGLQSCLDKGILNTSQRCNFPRFKKQAAINIIIIFHQNRACEALEEQISLQEPILKQRLRDTGFLNKKTVEYQRQLDQLQVSSYACIQVPC